MTLSLVKPPVLVPVSRDELVTLLTLALSALDDLKDKEPGAFYRAGLRAQIRTAINLESLPTEARHTVLRGDWIKKVSRQHGMAVLDGVREVVSLDESAVEKAMLALGKVQR